MFKEHLKSVRIELSSFEEFIAGKNIYYGDNGFEMIQPSRMNSTVCVDSQNAQQQLNLDVCFVYNLKTIFCCFVNFLFCFFCFVFFVFFVL